MVSVFLNNPLFQTYVAHCAILALKLLAVAPLTSIHRISRGVFANPEDVLNKKSKVKFDDPTIERVRRAHLNDLENIPVFWILAALYVTTGPSAGFATLLFRAFTAGRILHTLVYAVIPMPQPARFLAFFVPYSIMWYMGLQVVFHYLPSL